MQHALSREKLIGRAGNDDAFLNSLALDNNLRLFETGAINLHYENNREINHIAVCIVEERSSHPRGAMLRVLYR